MGRLSLKYQYYAANLVVLWGALLFYHTNRYYHTTAEHEGFLSDRTQSLLLWMGIAYTVGGLVYYFFSQAATPTHAYVALRALRRWLQNGWGQVRGFSNGLNLPVEPLSRSELTSVLFLALKLFYLPMMFEFMTGNWHSLASRWWGYSGLNVGTLANVMQLPRLEAFNDFVFPCLIDVFFTLECAFYAFGYAIESPRCRNVIRSVDRSFLGWAAALACYPPFNGLVNNWVAWYSSDEPKLANPAWNVALRVAVLVLFALYLYGAVSLGTKCSNLTNRGIVTGGAFAYVRHPAYAAKNLAWWLGLWPALSQVPVLSKAFWFVVLSMAFWSFVYFLRAVTEERHLMNDPEYQAYCKKVRYRFIPGVW